MHELIGADHEQRAVAVGAPRGEPVAIGLDHEYARCADLECGSPRSLMGSETGDPHAGERIVGEHDRVELESHQIRLHARAVVGQELAEGCRGSAMRRIRPVTGIGRIDSRRAPDLSGFYQITRATS